MRNVPQILNAIDAGDAQAAEQLLPLVYDELRKLAAAKMAQESPGHTLDATALVHEAYVRLVHGADEKNWDGRGHFFTAAAEAMRRILVNKARDRARQKRGGGWKRVDFDQLDVAARATDDQLVALDQALQQLGQMNQPCADLVKLRFFAGLSITEAAMALK